jgi:hypothetical protein
MPRMGSRGASAGTPRRSCGRAGLAARYEYLDDTDGGFMTFGGKAQTVTVTSEHVVAQALRIRLEYRGDFTDSPFFTDEDGGLKDSQQALTVGVVYSFNGRI